MQMGPASSGRLLVGLAAMALLAVMVWKTMEPGRLQQVTWLLLGFFAVRMLLGWLRSGRMGTRASSDEQPDEKG